MSTSKRSRAAQVKREMAAEQRQPPSVLTGRVEQVTPIRPTMARRLSEGPSVRHVKGKGI